MRRKFNDLEKKFSDLNLSPNDYFEWLVMLGFIESDLKNYPEAVKDTCRKSITWFISKIDLNILPEELFKVVDGTVIFGEVSMFQHTWIEIDNEYILDYTVCQFDSSLPKLFFKKKSEIDWHDLQFRTNLVQSPADWIKSEMKIQEMLAEDKPLDACLI